MIETVYPHNEDFGNGNFDYNNYCNNVKQKRNKTILTVVAVIMTILIVVGVGVGCYFWGANNQLQQNMKSELALANEVYTLINQYYYKDIDKDEFNKFAALGLASAMDQYSGLSMSTSAATSKFGISIKSDKYNHHIVTYVNENSPLGKNNANAIKGQLVNSDGEVLSSAYDQYLERGDMIYKVDGNLVEGLDSSVLSTNVLGMALHPVVIVRKTNGSYAQFVLKRAFYNDKEAEYRALTNDVGYIKLNSFTGTASEDFVACANQFLNSSQQKLVLDLRDNGGGSSNILQTIASYFIHDSKGNSNGLPVMKIKMQKENEVITYPALGNNWFGKSKTNYKLAVLINENSASASEALLGAIKYYCPEATIIGCPTYGKGIAQQTFQLENGPYFLSITTGYFYVPTLKDGKETWITNHGVRIAPTTGYQIEQLPTIDFSKSVQGYYNNDITKEIAVDLAIKALA